MASDSIKFSVLASGSTGNSIFISCGNTKILIDAGLSGKETESRLNQIGESAQNIDAILLSHEHQDHIKGAGVLSRRYNIPVIATPGTLAASEPVIKKINCGNKISPGTPFFIGDLRINPFSISHDAADPCGFTIRSSSSKLGVATDLGIATTLVKTRLKGCTGLVLEANHDPEKLASGPYPWPLKQRIKSRLGHLSNHEAGELLNEIYSSSLAHVVLSHISMENNSHEIALKTVCDATPSNFSGKIESASQDKTTGLFEI